jgi:catechol 2,3-dioxygenase-like lactoylglutathione lyase family enzyme
MAAVQGIGGVFIYSNDAARLAQWYQTALGVKMEAHPDGDKYYRVFTTRDAETSAIRENPVFAIYQAESGIAENGRRFMLNLRVDNLALFLEQVRGNAVLIEPDILEWSRGRHAWIVDLDGNRVELYEEIMPESPVT